MSSHMFIQPEQIRAARALLDWSQQDLADASSVSKDTVKNYELSNNKPNTQTLTRIIGALEVAGIEFLSDGGLRPSRERIRTIEGSEGVRHLMDLIYKTCIQDPLTPVIIANVNEYLFNKHIGDYQNFHRNRLENIPYLNPCKVILAKGKILENPAKFIIYRWIDQVYFGDVSIYCFDKYVAILELSDNKCLVHLIENDLLSNTFMKLLNLMWANAGEDEFK